MVCRRMLKLKSNLEIYHKCTECKSNKLIPHEGIILSTNDEGITTKCLSCGQITNFTATRHWYKKRHKEMFGG